VTGWGGLGSTRPLPSRAESAGAMFCAIVRVHASLRIFARNAQKDRSARLRESVIDSSSLRLTASAASATIERIPRTAYTAYTTAIPCTLYTAYSG
jgi:hypothetical protein